MKTMKILSVAVLCLAASMVLAEPAPKLSITTKAKAVKAGAWVDAVLTVEFAPGLHGYQNPPNPKDVIPILLRGTNLVEVKDVQYPKGKVKTLSGIKAAVVEGKLTIPFKFRALKGGPKGLPFEFRVQQCDDSNCFIPQTITTYLNIKVDGTAQPTPPAKPK